MSEKRIGHGHGTVFASGAPHSDHQLVLSLTDVIGEKEINQVIQFIQKSLSGPALHHKVADDRVFPCQRPQFLHIIGIGQEAHIKDKVRVLGNPIFETKGKDGDEHVIEILVLQENLLQLLSQFPGQQLACINDEISILFKECQLHALLLNPLVQAAGPGKGMAAPCFLISLNKGAVVGIQEQDLEIQARVLPSLKDGFQLV